MPQTKTPNIFKSSKSKRATPSATRKKGKYFTINQNAAALALGTISFFFSIMIIIGFQSLEDTNASGVQLNSPGGAILFILSSFIEATVLGYAISWLYNKYLEYVR